MARKGVLPPEQGGEWKKAESFLRTVALDTEFEASIEEALSLWRRAANKYGERVSDARAAGKAFAQGRSSIADAEGDAAASAWARTPAVRADDPIARAFPPRAAVGGRTALGDDGTK
jgi:hypothetical protein